MKPAHRLFMIMKKILFLCIIASLISGFFVGERFLVLSAVFLFIFIIIHKAEKAGR